MRPASYFVASISLLSPLAWPRKDVVDRQPSHLREQQGKGYVVAPLHGAISLRTRFWTRLSLVALGLLGPTCALLYLNVVCRFYASITCRLDPHGILPPFSLIRASPCFSTT